jgi:hypothetical protein
LNILLLRLSPYTDEIIGDLFAKYKENDQVEEDEMDEACSTNGGEEECI